MVFHGYLSCLGVWDSLMLLRHQPLGVIFFLPARQAMDIFFTGAQKPWRKVNTLGNLASFGQTEGGNPWTISAPRNLWLTLLMPQMLNWLRLRFARTHLFDLQPDQFLFWPKSSLTSLIRCQTGASLQGFTCLAHGSSSSWCLPQRVASSSFSSKNMTFPRWLCLFGIQVRSI